MLQLIISKRSGAFHVYCAPIKPERKVDKVLAEFVALRGS